MPFRWFSRARRPKHTERNAASKKEFRSAITIGAPPQRTLRGMVGEFFASLVNRPRRADLARVLEQLTPREREIAIRAAQGYTNKQIADDLVISPETVKSHMRSILIKLGLHSKTELRVYWRERDWSQGEE